MNLLPSKSSRKGLAIVLAVSLVVHVMVLLVFGAVKFVVKLVDEDSVFDVAPVDTPPQLKPEYVVNIDPDKPAEPNLRQLRILPESSVAIDIPAVGINVEFKNKSAAASTSQALE